MKKQNYSCAICKRHQSEFKTRLAVDHHHGTKEIFGLLCTSCNLVLIGKLRNPELYLAAYEYLKQGTGWYVPIKKKKKRKRKRHVRCK